MKVETHREGSKTAWTIISWNVCGTNDDQIWDAIFYLDEETSWTQYCNTGKTSG